ncbi:MAG: HlyD family efflux transporter periplasmic adaptor subunit [Planctomycetales bacterium]|nr:HlyD family efflux transporter periplasmic adaptor subunit [Planctomycetales bacterium]
MQTSRAIRRAANFTFVLLLAAVAAMAFAPWQQSAKGTGEVVAYVPQERQQTVTSPAKGVIARVAEGIVEGSIVKQGQFIVEVQPNAANLVEQKRAQLKDLQAKLETAEVKVEVYGQNVVDYSSARDFAVAAAAELVQAAEAKLSAKKNLVAGYEAKELQARLNLERQEALFAKGIQSEKEIEKLRKDWNVARSELDSVMQEVAAAANETTAKRNELEQKRSEAQAKVDYARAMQQDAMGQMATIRKEMRDQEIYLAELQRLVITAPRDGAVLRMPVFERGQVVKEGDPLFTIVPTTSQRAVELYVSGNDVPLVRVGDDVRLQFEGWPAVQFVGWPSVAVGTFGGKVSAIDATDNGKGKFRVLVQPDEGAEWPSGQFLRQGGRANGWVMLGQVSLGYEIWRKLNGFPAVISAEEPGESEDKAKKVKLPK